MATFVEGDRERWAEEVLITLIKATDRNGLKVALSPEHQISVLAFATAVLVSQQQNLGEPFTQLINLKESI